MSLTCLLSRRHTFQGRACPLTAMTSDKHCPVSTAALSGYGRFAGLHVMTGDTILGWRLGLLCCRQEFKQYVAKKEKVVQRTFAKLDVDNSGYIDADELVSCCLTRLQKLAAAGLHAYV